MGEPLKYWMPPRFDEDGVQSTSGIGEDGKEYPDPVPLAASLEFQPSVDILQTIDRVVSSRALREQADREGFDTPEEAMDLEMEDDPPGPLSPYEEHFWPDPSLRKAASGQGETGEKKAAATAPSPSPTPTSGEDTTAAPAAAVGQPGESSG